MREHKTLGPYVQGLTKRAVATAEEIEALIEQGTAQRHTASTKMNQASSRSHAVFNIIFTAEAGPHHQGTGGNDGADPAPQKETVSRISLVDLAGSERRSLLGNLSKKTSKEGTNINKSLTVLGKVINKLAEEATSGKKAFIPYRDSVQTWLLRDNLGGNSKTVMIATIGPASTTVSETITTLRYADSAKKIVNKATVNEDASSKIVRQLREEIAMLREQIGTGHLGAATAFPIGTEGTESGVDSQSGDGVMHRGDGVMHSAEVFQLRKKLGMALGLIDEMTETWDEKRQNSGDIVADREVLESHRSAVSGGGGCVRLTSKAPSLIGMFDSDGTVAIYTLSHPETTIGTRCRTGSSTSTSTPSIQVTGMNFDSELEGDMCVIERLDHDGAHGAHGNQHPYPSGPYPRAFLVVKQQHVFVNGASLPVGTRQELHHGNVLMIGIATSFQFVNASEFQFQQSNPGQSTHTLNFPPHTTPTPTATTPTPTPTPTAATPSGGDSRSSGDSVGVSGSSGGGGGSSPLGRPIPASLADEITQENEALRQRLVHLEALVNDEKTAFALQREAQEDADLVLEAEDDRLAEAELELEKQLAEAAETGCKIDSAALIRSCSAVEEETLSKIAVAEQTAIRLAHRASMATVKVQEAEVAVSTAIRQLSAAEAATPTGMVTKGRRQSEHFAHLSARRFSSFSAFSMEDVVARADLAHDSSQRSTQGNSTSVAQKSDGRVLEKFATIRASRFSMTDIMGNLQGANLQGTNLQGTTATDPLADTSTDTVAPSKISSASHPSPNLGDMATPTLRGGGGAGYRHGGVGGYVSSHLEDLSSQSLRACLLTLRTLRTCLLSP